MNMKKEKTGKGPKWRQQKGCDEWNHHLIT